MEVNGTLIAKGSSTDLIDFNDAYVYFTPLTPGQYQANTGSEIEFVDFTPRPLDRPQAIYMDSTSPKITNNIIHGYITVEGYSAPVISENVFIDGGIQDSSKAGHTISNNVLSQTRLSWSGGTPVIVVDAGYAVQSVKIVNNTVSGGTIGIRGSGTITNNHISKALNGISGGSIGAIVTDNAIVECDCGISGECVIQRNLITGNEKSDGISTNGNATILNNTITGNKNGIHMQKTDTDYWQGAMPDTLIAHYNNIYGNTEYNIRIDSFDNADATDNWWGTTDTAAISPTFYDYNDDYHLGTVDYLPILAEFNEQVMLSVNEPTSDTLPSGAPTSTPNTSITPSQTYTTTLQPSDTQVGISFGLDWKSLAIVGLGVVVVVLSVALIWRGRRVKVAAS
jgi:hypothetical protein